MSMRPGTPSYIPELQSVRGIAALLVLASHCMAYWTAPPVVHLVSKAFNSHGSVVLFFLLSGYVLGRSLYGNDFSRGAVLRFYVKRFFRIYPALWSASLFALLYLFFLHWAVPVAGTSDWFQHRFLPERMTVLGILASFAGVLAFLIPAAWTVFVEIVGSLFLPFIAWASLRKDKIVFWLVLAGAMAVSLAFGSRTYYGIATYMVDFVAGAAITILPQRIVESWRRWRLAKYVFFLAVVLLLSARYFINGYAIHDPRTNTFELLLAWIIVASIAVGNVRPKLLQSKLFVWLGDISYSLYLLHFTIMCVVAKAMYLLMGNTDPVLLSFGLLAATIAGTLPLATLQYRYIEQPIIACVKTRLGFWGNKRTMISIR